MHESYEYEYSYNLGSGKRYKVDYGDCFGHHHTNISEARPKLHDNSRREGGLIPPTPQKLLVNPPIVNQSSPKGQVPPSS
jgi:hypothetical protein